MLILEPTLSWESHKTRDWNLKNAESLKTSDNKIFRCYNFVALLSSHISIAKRVSNVAR